MEPSLDTLSTSVDVMSAESIRGEHINVKRQDSLKEYMVDVG